MFYWNQVHETGNLSFLIRSRNPTIKKKLPGRLQGYALSILWRQILDEHIGRFGFAEGYIEIVRKQKEILRLRVDRIVNEDRSLNAFIRIAEDELSDLESNKSKGSNFYEIKGVLEKNGFKIHPFKTTVEEFYTHVQTLTKQLKKTAS